MSRLSSFLDPGPQGGFECDDEDQGSPTCKFCGAPELEWVDIGMGRWRLYEGQRMHKCPDTTMDDFEDLTR